MIADTEWQPMHPLASSILLIIERTSLCTPACHGSAVGKQYERELRQVLIGSPDGVRAVTRSCSTEERIEAMKVIDRPFLVLRAAGSGTAGVGDLLAIRGDISFPIEVKSSTPEVIYLSGRTLEQYESMRSEGERCGLMPIYAHRVKGKRGDSWRIFRVETENLRGRLRSLAMRIPSLPTTGRGRPHLDWNKGMPLHRFLSLVCTDRNGSGST